MIRLWIREDGEQPKAIGRHPGAAPPPGPGKVVDVEAKTSEDARKVYATTLRPEPSEEQDPVGWTDWRRCARMVKPVEIVLPVKVRRADQPKRAPEVTS